MENKIKKIVSCSRRTDIPAFYMDWLQKVLEKREITVSNPMFPEKHYTYSLSQEDIKCIVLWSKNFEHVVSNPGLLEDYNLIFNYTITGYSKALEPNVPDYNESIKTVERLLTRYSPESIQIRWDPIILSATGEVYPTPEKLGEARLKHLDTICKDVSSLGINSLIFSFVELYPHVKKRLDTNGFKYVDLNDDLKILFTKKMVDIASKYGVTLKCCSQPLLENVEGIHKSHCIDADLIEKLFGKDDGRVSHAKDGGQRKSCGCAKSIDVGNYDGCKHGCIYCYQKSWTR